MSTKKPSIERFEKLVDNWPSKVVCIVAAIIIYFFHQISILDKKTFVVPVEVISDGLLIPDNDFTRYVKISVRTNSRDIGTVYSTSLKAYLNLSSFTEAGEYDVSVNVVPDKSILLLEPLEITVKPETIKVLLDNKKVKYVPVHPVVSGEPGSGYSVKNIEIIPSSVKITGPAKIVDATEFVYSSKINVKGATKGFSSEIFIDNVNRMVQAEYDEKLKANIMIAAMTSELSFKNIVPQLVSLSGELKVENAILPVSFKLNGTVQSLDKFKLTDSSVTLNMSSINLPGVYEIPLVFNLPQGISVSEKSYERFTVTVVKNEAVQMEKTASDVGGEILEDSALNKDDKTDEEKADIHDNKDKVDSGTTVNSGDLNDTVENIDRKNVESDKIKEEMPVREESNDVQASLNSLLQNIQDNRTGV